MREDDFKNFGSFHLEFLSMLAINITNHLEGTLIGDNNKPWQTRPTWSHLEGESVAIYRHQYLLKESLISYEEISKRMREFWEDSNLSNFHQNVNGSFIILKGSISSLILLRITYREFSSDIESSELLDDAKRIDRALIEALGLAPT